MAIDTKDPTSLKWQLTINNPTEQGWSHEAIKKDQTNCNHYRTHFRKKQGKIFCAKKREPEPPWYHMEKSSTSASDGTYGFLS